MTGGPVHVVIHGVEVEVMIGRGTQVKVQDIIMMIQEDHDPGKENRINY